jgi:hypothetical protein
MLHLRGGIGCPRMWTDIAVRFWSRFVGTSAVAILSIALCGLSGTAMSQTATPAAAPLPDIVVDAPKHVATSHKPTQHTVGRRIVSHPTSVTAQAPSRAAEESVTAKLAKLERNTGSCAGGCQSSFRSGNEPWHGCNGSGWPALSLTCRNIGNYKTYNECLEAGLLTGWRVTEAPWYCSSLALK